MNFTHTISRLPAPNFADGLTTVTLGAPDYETMLAQHAAYVQTLRDIGLTVTLLDALPDFPDAHFVEDVAVMTPEVAILTNPGAPERNGEQAPMEPILAQFLDVAHITAPAIMDGGDVLEIGTHFVIGLSQRTNKAGAEQFGAIVAKHGYTWATVDVADGLHLKSSVNTVIGDNGSDDTILLTAEFIDHPAFADYAKIVVDDDETYAANVVRINDSLLMPRGFPKTRAKLAATGLQIIEMETSESQKMDGGLTCLSLRFVV